MRWKKFLKFFQFSKGYKIVFTNKKNCMIWIFYRRKNEKYLHITINEISYYNLIFWKNSKWIIFSSFKCDFAFLEKQKRKKNAKTFFWSYVVCYEMTHTHKKIWKKNCFGLSREASMEEVCPPGRSSGTIFSWRGGSREHFQSLSSKKKPGPTYKIAAIL